MNKITKLLEFTKVFVDLEIFLEFDKRQEYLTNFTSKCIFMTATDYMRQLKNFRTQNITFKSIIVDDAQLLDETETACIILSNPKFNKLVLAGSCGYHKRSGLKYSHEGLINSKSSLFERLLDLNYPQIKLDTIISKSNFDSISSICTVVNELKGPIHISYKSNDNVNRLVTNINETEFSTALFMYLVIKGCNKNDIAILCNTYEQVKHIHDNIASKCGFFERIGFPSFIGTVEDFEGKIANVVVYSTVTDKNIKLSLMKEKYEYVKSRAAEIVFFITNEYLYTHQALLDTSFSSALQPLRLPDENKNLITIADYNQLYTIIKDLLINY